MKESKKKNWWKSLTPEEQENPKNVKKLFHRPFFQRRREAVYTIEMPDVIIKPKR